MVCLGVMGGGEGVLLVNLNVISLVFICRWKDLLVLTSFLDSSINIEANILSHILKHFVYSYSESVQNVDILLQCIHVSVFQQHDGHFWPFTKLPNDHIQRQIV